MWTTSAHNGIVTGTLLTVDKKDRPLSGCPLRRNPLMIARTASVLGNTSSLAFASASRATAMCIALFVPQTV